MNSIIRVFPYRNSFTPTDDMAFFEEPGLFIPDHDAVHVCCVFTWDIERCKELQFQWQGRTNKSISIIIAGVRRCRIGVVNLGMVSIAALVMARFFDVDVSFIVRGVVFVLIGICFLVANVVLVRRKAGWSSEK